MIVNYCERCSSRIPPSPPAARSGRFFALEKDDRITAQGAITQDLQSDTVYRIGLPGTLVGRKVSALHICEACHDSLVEWTLAGGGR